MIDPYILNALIIKRVVLRPTGKQMTEVGRGVDQSMKTREKQTRHVRLSDPYRDRFLLTSTGARHMLPQ